MQAVTARWQATASCSSDRVPVTYPAPADAGEIQRQSAPAAADVENAIARVDAELRRNVALLGQLGGFETGIGRFEVGASAVRRKAGLGRSSG